MGGQTTPTWARQRTQQNRQAMVRQMVSRNQRPIDPVTGKPPEGPSAPAETPKPSPTLESRQRSSDDQFKEKYLQGQEGSAVAKAHEIGSSISQGAAAAGDRAAEAGKVVKEIAKSAWERIKEAGRGIVSGKGDKAAAEETDAQRAIRLGKKFKKPEKE